MVAQRGYGLAGPLAASPTGNPDRPSVRPKTQASDKRKLGFKEKRALELLPQGMNALRIELDALEGKLGDPDFAGRDPAAFQTATNQYGRVRGDLEKAEDEWLLSKSCAREWSSRNERDELRRPGARKFSLSTTRSGNLVPRGRPAASYHSSMLCLSQKA
jgi:hypothetical protein